LAGCLGGILVFEKTMKTCSAKCNFYRNTASALEPKKSKENIARVGMSQDLSGEQWLLSTNRYSSTREL